MLTWGKGILQIMKRVKYLVLTNFGGFDLKIVRYSYAIKYWFRKSCLLKEILFMFPFNTQTKPKRENYKAVLNKDRKVNCICGLDKNEKYA